MKITRLKDHELLQIISIESRNFIRKCNPDQTTNQPEPDKKEHYSIESLIAVSEILSCVDQLYFSKNMLSGYRKSMLKNKMNRFDYLLFGVENFYLRLTSVYERCLKLLNVIYKLELKDRECRNDIIFKNVKLKDSNLIKILKHFYKFLSKYRRVRNVIAHKNSYSDSELHDFEGFYYLIEDDTELEKYKNYFKIRSDEYVKKKKKQFETNIILIENFIEKILDELILPYKKTLDSF